MKMIQKLRWKFVFINMTIVTAILLVMGLSIFTATRDTLRQQSEDFLRSAAQENFSFRWPDLDKGKNQLHLPYFTIVVGIDGSVSLLDDPFGMVEDAPQLTSVATQAMEQPDALGELPAYGLRYLRRETILGWRITFAYCGQERSTLQTLAFSLILIGLVTLAVFFLISLRLAKWATGPVEESWARQRQFVSDASHELKTPLTVILSNVDLLEQQGEPHSPQERRWLDNIQAASGQMTQLVEGLLTLARYDNSANTPILRERVDLSELVEDQALLFEPVLFEAGKTLSDSIEPGIFVTGDGSKLRRLVAILLDNARKYAQPGSTVILRLNTIGKLAKLTVNTQGEPIPHDQLEKLFQRFYRAEQSRTSEGYGLGLAIAAQIAEEHKAKLWAESSSTEGNSFILTITKEK